MNDFGAVDPARSGRDLDLMTWTIYPVHGNANEGPLGFRLGSAASLSFAADFHRSVNGLHGIMELQPGQVSPIWPIYIRIYFRQLLEKEIRGRRAR